MGPCIIEHLLNDIFIEYIVFSYVQLPVNLLTNHATNCAAELMKKEESVFAGVV